MDNTISSQTLYRFARSLRVLYVEDNEQARESTLGLLRNFFNTIYVAGDGREGLKVFDEGIDLIVTDINMPRLDGLEMLHRIKERSPLPPVLILSAHNDAEYFLETIKLGVSGYILKPIDSRQFLDTLLQTVEKIYLKKQLQEHKRMLERKLQQQLELLSQKDDLLLQQSKLAAMGEMMDIVAHQWKQPLGIIRMHGDMVGELLEDETLDTQSVQECRESVALQVQHLLDTLEEFRAFFRPGGDTENTSIDTLFDSLRLLLHDDLIKNRITLQLPEKTDLFLQINPGELKHLFINLINNARDAFNQNGCDERTVTIAARQEGSSLHISVEDSAGGIEEKIMENIFMPHFTTRQQQGGTGMGLYMCRMIAQKYGGTISVQNGAKGARFAIKLPL